MRSQPPSSTFKFDAPTGVKSQLVAMANRVGESLTGDFSQIQQLVDDNDVVIALWEDLTEPDRVGMMVIKGKQLLREVCASGGSRKLRMTAIPCACPEQALALHEVSGERDASH